LFILFIVRLWSEDWGMTVNLKKGKTEHMVFGGERKQNFTLHFSPEVVCRTKAYKYLGVMLDSEDTKLSMLAQRQKTLRTAYGAHNPVAQLQVASPDMPLGTIGSIWQTWVLPQLCYGIGAWGRSDSTEVLPSPTGVARCSWGQSTRCHARSSKRRWAGAACASGCGTISAVRCQGC